MLCQSLQATALILVHRGSLKYRMSGQCKEQGAEGRGRVLVRGCADSGGFLSPAAVSTYNCASDGGRRQRWQAIGQRIEMSGRENQSEKKL